MSALWNAAEAADATGGRAGGDFAATGVCIDSRQLRRGDLFVALRGTTDGHAHAAEAVRAGAAAAMVDHVPAGLAAGGALLVDDTTAGLSALGAAGRARFAGKVVAVTGSVGKTTTKDMLRLCLSQQGTAHAAEASHNNHWGVPLTLARLPRAASACVVEIGMNHAGEIAPLSMLAAPDVAVITTIGTAHVGHLGSVEAIADEKAAIATGLRTGGVAVLPGDSALLGRLRAAMPGVRTRCFGSDAAMDGVLEHVEPAPRGSRVRARIGGRVVGFELPAPGRHMAMNAVAALLATQAAGMDVAAAAAALAAFAPAPGRGALRRIGLEQGSVSLLDESYNASLASMLAALEVLALQPASRRIAVLGDMRELGAHSEAEHAALAGPAADAATMIFTCGAEMAALHAALPPARRGGHAADAAALAPVVAAALRAGDAVLVKGSNGSNMALVARAIEALDRAVA